MNPITPILEPVPEEFIDKQTGEIIYPDSDGEPMAENTKQFDWISTLKLGLEAGFKKRTDVFVAGDLFWYPVEGQPQIRVAADVLVVLGRPKGHRGSYKQWLEEDIPPQVVFEILSPSNNDSEMLKKLRFYNRYGVDEFYIYNPEENELFGWQRNHDRLATVPFMQNWTSPILGIRFELQAETMIIYHADNSPFLTFLEQGELLEQANLEKELALKQLEEERKAKEEEQQAKEEALAQVEKLKNLLKQQGLDIDFDNL